MPLHGQEGTAQQLRPELQVMTPVGNVTEPGILQDVDQPSAPAIGWHSGIT